MINTFTVGCDPEFVVLDEKAKILAVDSGIADPDLKKEIGFDHNGRVMEFRPKPTQGTFALCRRLQRLVNEATEQFTFAKKFRAGATCAGESLGGHVHFGIPVKFELQYTMVPGLDGLPVKLATGSDLEAKTKQKLTALDRVTYILEHLDILPMNESANRRKGRYGKWGEYRDSNGHIEYRTMASWLFDPRVAFLCLTAAKLAAADPTGTLENLGKVVSFDGLQKWIEKYKEKDANAKRAIERIFEKGGLKSVQIDPDVDFRERWKELGI